MVSKILIIIYLFISTVPLQGASVLPTEKIKLPPGFKISVFASGLDSVREMTFSPSGVLYAGSMDGNVYAVKNGKSYVIARNLLMPVGVAFRDGSLYVSAVSRILRLDNIETSLDNPPKPVAVTSAYPTDTHHGWKFIRFGPDGRLYVPEGAPCNICIPKNRIYASITRINADGSGMEIFAGGIRNTVGFDWNPLTGELWFTDNGRDNLGDNLPPDELNRAFQKDMNFGYPFIHGKGILDPDVGKEMPAGFTYTPPEMELGPHVASIGMRFYTGTQFPESYRNQIFIAEHGSWNRSVPVGYRVTLVKLDPSGKKAVSYEVFASGWLENGRVWGRPADVENGPDGSLFVSDDTANAIYRISYEP